MDVPGCLRPYLEKPVFAGTFSAILGGVEIQLFQYCRKLFFERPDFFLELLLHDCNFFLKIFFLFYKRLEMVNFLYKKIILIG